MGVSMSRIGLIGCVAAVLLSGCTPVIYKRGYLPDPVAEAGIIVGKDTKQTIQKKLGDPSTRATFGNDGWYYISSLHQQVAFFAPTVLQRNVLVVSFNKNDQVTGLHHYGLKDGHVVAFETRTTPAPGREITFLQQLLSATPGVPTGGAGGGIGGQSPGAPGGGH